MLTSFFISNYAANAGKSGGEFFTLQNIVQTYCATGHAQQTSVNKIYDRRVVLARFAACKPKTL